MRIAICPQNCDIEHTIAPLIRILLRDFDAVIVSPWMGVDQYKEFGEKVIVDCRDYMGFGYGPLLAKQAQDAGLSSIRCLCPHPKKYIDSEEEIVAEGNDILNGECK